MNFVQGCEIIYLRNDGGAGIFFSNSFDCCRRLIGVIPGNTVALSSSEAHSHLSGCVSKHFHVTGQRLISVDSKKATIPGSSIGRQIV